MGFSLLESDYALSWKRVPQVGIGHVLKAHYLAENSSPVQVRQVWREKRAKLSLRQEPWQYANPSVVLFTVYNLVRV